MIASTISLLALGVVVASAASRPDQSNWPQWRGPLATGEAPAGNPPQSWSETENVKWKIKIPGAGTATPIIWGDSIFLQTAIAGPKKAPEPKKEGEQPAPPPGQGRRGGPGGMRGEKPTEVHKFALLCLDRATAKIRWEKVAKEELPHEGHHRDHGFSSYSPITDGQSVYAFFGSRGLYCYDLNGNIKWSKDLGKMETKNGFGEGSSPALYGNTLVINWDHQGEDFIVAFDKNTGNELWRQSRDEETSWSTPLIVQHDGKSQVVTSATRKIRSYDLATGKQLWECSGMTANAIPTPVPGKDVVFATSGFRGSSLLAIRLGKSGDLTGTDAIAWSKNKSTPYVPSPLLYQDRLYLLSGNEGILSVFQAGSGNILVDAERLQGVMGVYASPVAANGKIYLVGRNGGSVVLKASDKLEVLSTNKLDEKFDASPAIAGNELFLRGHEHLYCIGQ